VKRQGITCMCTYQACVIHQAIHTGASYPHRLSKHVTRQRRDTCSMALRSLISIKSVLSVQMGIKPVCIYCRTASEYQMYLLSRLCRALGAEIDSHTGGDSEDRAERTPH
jgi:hypothetical protein